MAYLFNKSEKKSDMSFQILLKVEKISIILVQKGWWCEVKKKLHKYYNWKWLRFTENSISIKL
jgi:hypothetical protein